MKDWKELRALVDMSLIEFDAAIFLGSCVLSDSPSVIWWLITWRLVGCHYMMQWR